VGISGDRHACSRNILEVAGAFGSGVGRGFSLAYTARAHRPSRPLPPRGPVVPAGSGSNRVKLNENGLWAS
jgi:hypothetical protein